MKISDRDLMQFGAALQNGKSAEFLDTLVARQTAKTVAKQERFNTASDNITPEQAKTVSTLIANGNQILGLLVGDASNLVSVKLTKKVYNAETGRVSPQTTIVYPNGTKISTFAK